MKSLKKKIKNVNSLIWIFEPLEKNPNYILKKMFGCEAAYLGDTLVLVIAAKEEPWNGLLVPTSREYHDSLRSDWKDLVVHPVLGKWLYISQSHRNFESTVNEVVECICRGDERIGVVSKRG